MSQENVEVVLVANAVLEPDLVRWLQDDAVWNVFAAHLHPDFEHVSVNRVEDRVVHHNAEAFRRGWSLWVAPWESYWQEIEEVLDRGERVLLLVTHHAQMKGSEAEIKLPGASLWTVRDGLIVRMESYTDRAEALTAVGLEE
jgi:ketosteroid isomerase-like protein